MKKAISILLSILLVCTFAAPVFASEAQGEIESEDNAIYVLSEPISEEAYRFVDENSGPFILEMITVNELDISMDSISVGTPFTVEYDHNTAIFPILCDGEIVFTFYVYFDEVANEYVGYMSMEHASELDQLSTSTDEDHPAQLHYDDKEIVGEVMSSSDVSDNFAANSELSVVNLADSTIAEIDLPITTMAAPARASISLSRTEEQKDQSWCAAFAGAAIIRTVKKNDVKAKTIMKYAHPNVSDAALKNKTLSQAKLKAFAKSKHSLNSTSKSAALSASTVISQINKKKPIYMHCDGTGSYVKDRHALVLTGYDNVAATYTVWNPWHKNKLAVISQSTKTLKVSGGSFVWKQSIYNWRAA